MGHRWNARAGCACSGSAGVDDDTHARSPSGKGNGLSLYTGQLRERRAGEGALLGRVWGFRGESGGVFWIFGGCAAPKVSSRCWLSVVREMVRGTDPTGLLRERRSGEGARAGRVWGFRGESRGVILDFWRGRSAQFVGMVRRRTGRSAEATARLVVGRFGQAGTGATAAR